MEQLTAEVANAPLAVARSVTTEAPSEGAEQITLEVARRSAQALRQLRGSFLCRPPRRNRRREIAGRAPACGHEQCRIQTRCRMAVPRTCAPPRCGAAYRRRHLRRAQGRDRVR